MSVGHHRQTVCCGPYCYLDNMELIFTDFVFGAYVKEDNLQFMSGAVHIEILEPTMELSGMY